MELFGILLSAPAAFVAVAVWCHFLPVGRRWPWIRSTAKWTSTLILAGLLIEWVLLATLGAVRCRELLGPAFVAAHVAVVFLGVPALANLLILRQATHPRGWWLGVALACALFALPLALTQYSVFESLYGINGREGPFA